MGYLIGIILITSLLTFTYWFVKKVFNKKSARIVTITFTLVIGTTCLLTLFEDKLFTKANARKILTEQSIALNGDFVILENTSGPAIGEYYHTFTLQITTDDKLRIIEDIKRSSYLVKESEAIDIRLKTNYYTGSKIKQYYETQQVYVIESFEPQGEGYAPIYRCITIDKHSNTLKFEDIDD